MTLCLSACSRGMFSSVQSWDTPSVLAFVMSICGGIHYGYNVAVVSTVVKEIRNDLDAPESFLQIIIGSTLAGAIIGSPISGPIADYLGRRSAVVLGEIFSLLGVIGSTISFSKGALLVSRVTLGFGVGFCTLAKPLYASEVASPKTRGLIVSVFSPAIAGGILFAMATQALPFTDIWRVKFALGGVPPTILLCIAIFRMEESQVWRRQKSRAAAISTVEHLSDMLLDERSEVKDLTLVTDAENLIWGADPLRVASADGSNPCTTISRSLSSGYSGATVANRDVDSSEVTAKYFVTGIVLALGNQLTGIYSALMYAPYLVELEDNTTSWRVSVLTIFVSAINLLGSGCATVTVDRVGRRPLLLFGLGSMSICLYCIALTLLLTPTSSGAGYMSVCLLVATFVFAYQIGPGTCFFVVTTEMCPSHCKATVLSCSNAVKYVCELFTALCFASLVDLIGISATLAAFSTISLGCCAFVWFAVPETGSLITE